MFTISDIFNVGLEGPCEIAAIDLGSNSFHMIVARWHDGEITLLDRLKEPVRLGWGLSNGQLAPEAKGRALACLGRFGDRLRDFPKGSVRAVGTKTLRAIGTNSNFLSNAEAILGHPIEIISGEEEARLIYRGVGHWLETRSPRRVVVDIGGGSTEVIVGQGQEILFKESLSMGCVALTNQLFLDTHSIDASLLHRAHLSCLQEILPVTGAFQKVLAKTGTDLHQSHNLELLGASGTIKAIAKVCSAESWSDGIIHRDSLQKIKQRFEKDGPKAQFSGLSEDRHAVFLAGVCVLDAIFDGLNLESLAGYSLAQTGMQAAGWALREGVLFELKGRLENRDIRGQSVQALAQRFNVDEGRADAVAKTCDYFFDQLSGDWQLPKLMNSLLSWASQLYLVGLDIRHSDYHKHSAYIIENADLAGCSRSEQQQLAWLVRNHRKRINQKRLMEDHDQLALLLVIFRLAVVFQRGSLLWPLDQVSLDSTPTSLSIGLPKSWQTDQPLLMADLTRESETIRTLGVALDLIMI